MPPIKQLYHGCEVLMVGLYCRCGHVGNYKLIEMSCLVIVEMEYLIDKVIEEELGQKCNEHNT